MKLLLDENLPKRLKLDFPDHEIYTVQDKSWNGIKNGQLLQLMLEEKFDALLTFGKNLPFQQNFLKYTIAVFVLHAPNIHTTNLEILSPKVNEHLSIKHLPAGAIIVTI